MRIILIILDELNPSEHHAHTMLLAAVKRGTEISVKTTLLAKDADSGNGGCPSVHMREDGMVVVQAPEVDAETFRQLPNVLPGERAVYIDPQVILRAAGEIGKHSHR